MRDRRLTERSLPFLFDDHIHYNRDALNAVSPEGVAPFSWTQYDTAAYGG